MYCASSVPSELDTVEVCHLIKKLTNSPAQSVPRAGVHCRSIRNSPSLASAQERRQPVGKENGTLPPCRPDKPDTCTSNINKIKTKQESNKGYNNQQRL